MLKYLDVKMLKCKGFTLVEVVVSIFIIVLLAGIVFANYRQAGKQFALQRSASKLAQDIRRAEEMAMSAKEYNGINPRGGYGMHFDKTSSAKSYILFADCDGTNYQYDPGGNPCNGLYEKIETINFEGEVKIFSLRSSGVEVPSLDIVFTPPDPTIRVNKNEGKTASIYFTIDSKIRSVEVNPRGLIESTVAHPDCNCWLRPSYHDDAGCSSGGRYDYYWDCSPYNCQDPLCQGQTPPSPPTGSQQSPYCSGCSSGSCEYWMCAEIQCSDPHESCR